MSKERPSKKKIIIKVKILMFANQFTAKSRAFYSRGNDCLGRVKRYRVGVIKRIFHYQKMKYKVSMGNFVITKKGYDVLTTVTG